MGTSPLEAIVNPWGAPTLEGFQNLENVQDGKRISGSRRQFVKFYWKEYSKVCADKVRINEKTGTQTVLTTKSVPVKEEWVLIVTPGDKNIVETIAQDFHKKEHWTEYSAFRDGRTAPMGKDIEECEYISSGVALELKYLKVFTEEQLADGSDHLCNMIPNGVELREFARANCNVRILSQDSERIKQLEAQVARMTQLLDSKGNAVHSELMEKPKKAPVARRKRRTKEEMVAQEAA